MNNNVNMKTKFLTSCSWCTARGHGLRLLSEASWRMP